MKQKIFFITLIICVFGSMGANAQLLQWNTFGNTGLETTEASIFNNVNINASTLTTGSITAAGNANRLGGTNWFDAGNTAAGSTLSEAIAGNNYIQFVVTPLSGATFTPTSFVFNWDSSGTGPKNVALRSSVDGYAANLGAIAPVAAIGTANTIAISGITNSASAITFRIYGYGATSTAGSGGLDISTNVVNVTLNGTTTAACTPPTISSLSPAAGIVGSQVTITASSGSLSGATAVFNGITATTVSSSATQLVVTVPTGATTGNLVITDTQPCSATTTFTVLTAASACAVLSDLIISEVTDTNYGGLSYIEIYNGTGVSVDLSAYNLQFYANGAASPYATTGVSGVPAFSGMLGNDQTYTVSTSPSASQCGITGGNGSLANLITTVNGVNFGVAADDQIVLYKGITKIDSWGDATGNWSSSLGIGTSGADFRRNPTAATLPSTTYINADWTVIDWAGTGSGACPTNDYTDIGTYNYTPTLSTTWNGTSWSNGAPTLSLLTIINGTYNTALNGSFEACSLIVKGSKTLTIAANQYVAIQYNLTVKPTGNIIVNDNGSLIQIDDTGVNSGSIDVKRVATIKKTDYVYWSSPVSGFGVQSISPGSPTSLIWKWNTTLANANGGEGTWQNTSEIMQESKGYIVRGPDSYNNAAAADFTATFTGTPFTGVCQPSIFRGNDTNAGSTGPNGIMRSIKDDNWNLLGNPYPCSISAIKFLTLNANIDGNIRLWTHGTLPNAAVLDPFYGNFVYNYDPSDYITYNVTGSSSGPSAFNGYIASGQGFFVIMNDGPADATQKVTFNNSLRETVGSPNTYYDNSYFYKANSPTNNSSGGQKGRIWLDLINNSSSKSSRALIGYLSGATLAKDRLYDAFFVVGNSMSIYSLIDDEAMNIQGRPAPFINSDVVPIGVKISTAGSHTIALGAIDGLFENANREIYIEDTMTGVIHNLRTTAYTFTSEAGKFTNRFKLRYQNRTGAESHNPHYTATAEKVLVYCNQNTITAYSFSEKIVSIKVYDLLGRSIEEIPGLNSQEVIMNLPDMNHQPVILKITLENDEIISKKLLF
ncbi:lamin tail domain-containing protein [Flavobacterium sp.]|uniref:lamin tail domain-containing protein n=1 Tax=Flavobacterium sp. TaxID=239 RepID=UPI0025FAC5E0|nr:lamin tail domain-containing protein [Flavobacterium sp.]